MDGLGVLSTVLQRARIFTVATLALGVEFPGDMGFWLGHDGLLDRETNTLRRLKPKTQGGAAIYTYLRLNIRPSPH